MKQRQVEFGAEGRTRTDTAFATAPSRQRVYQFHHFGQNIPKAFSTRTNSTQPILFIMKSYLLSLSIYLPGSFGVEPD